MQDVLESFFKLSRAYTCLAKHAVNRSWFYFFVVGNLTTLTVTF